MLEELGFYWFEEAFGGSLKHLDLFVGLEEAMPTVMASGGGRFTERFNDPLTVSDGVMALSRGPDSVWS